MKKTIWAIACIIALGFTCSCSSDDNMGGDSSEIYQNGAGIIETAGPQVVNLPESITKVIAVVGSDTSVVDVPNHKLIVKSNSFNVMQLYDENYSLVETVALKSATSDVDVNKKETEFNVSSYGKTFIAKIPEKGNNGAGLPLNFAYTSKGESFNIYPIYSNTSNRITLGIFWYSDKNDVKTQDIWEMNDEWYAKGTHMDSRPYYYKVSAETSKAINVYVPRGVTFGFYVYTHSDKTKRYTDASLNNCISNSKHANKAYATHALTYNEGKYTYLGIEDGHSDTDYNDLVLLIDPEQEVMENPTPDKVEDKKKELQEDGTTYVVTEDYIHTTINKPYVDVEARLKAPYPYFRLNLPVERNKNLEIDLSKEFGEFITEQDDLRIVGANDVTVAYIAKGEEYNKDGIKVVNNYPIITMSTDQTISEGNYTLKIEGSPKENQFNSLVNKIKQIYNGELMWDNIIKESAVINNTPKEPKSDITYWDEQTSTFNHGEISDANQYYVIQINNRFLLDDQRSLFTGKGEVGGSYYYAHIKKGIVDLSMNNIAGGSNKYVFGFSVNGNGNKTYTMLKDNATPYCPHTPKCWNNNQACEHHLDGLRECTRQYNNSKK